jgi:hypothetical protein
VPIQEIKIISKHFGLSESKGYIAEVERFSPDSYPPIYGMAMKRGRAISHLASLVGMHVLEYTGCK